MLAAYLDGTLDEAGRAAVEAWMASAPEALELMIAARAELAEPLGAPGAAPVVLVSRAQDLVRAPLRVSAGLGTWLRGLIGFEPAAWRPLAWAGVTAVLLVVSAGGFELGRQGVDRLVPVQTAALGDDLGLGLDDPADDLI
jgi:anti-sigma factor RsiW